MYKLLYPDGRADIDDMKSVEVLLHKNDVSLWVEVTIKGEEPICIDTIEDVEKLVEHLNNVLEIMKKENKNG